MKLIKNKTFTRAPTFVWALMLIPLILSTIGTTVWAKPDKPGKPSRPEPETADFNIRIGESTQDITLNPPNSFLYVNNVVGGYWLPPPTKGNYNIESLSLVLESLDPYGDPLDYCGKYTINNEVLAMELADHGIDSTVEAYRFIFRHITQNHPRVGENDYWRIAIEWQVGTLPIPHDPPIPHLHILMGETNTNAEWEGDYDQSSDTWTVTFNNAEFSLWENHESGESIELWAGQLSFTVEIQRILL